MTLNDAPKRFNQGQMPAEASSAVEVLKWIPITLLSRMINRHFQRP
jgi:hypothetical protein